MPLVLVRVFSPEMFGLYKQGFLVVGTCLSVLPLGFHVSAFYYLPREEERRGAVILNIMLFLAVTATIVLVVLCLFPGVLEIIFGHNRLTPYGPILGLTIFFWQFSSFLEMVATANQDVWSSTLFILFAQFTKASFMIVASLVFGTVFSVFLAAALQGLVQSLLLLWYVGSRFQGFWKDLQPSLFQEQLSYSLPFGFAGMLYSAGVDFHSYLVAHRFSSAEYALYSVGISPLQLVGLLRDSLIVVLLSRVSQLQSTGQHQAVKEVILNSVRKLSIAYIPAGAILLIMSKDVVNSLYTEQYISSWKFLAVNSFLLLSVPLVSDPVFRAYPRYRYTALRIRMATLILMITLTLVAIDTWGMLACMAAFVVATTLERAILFGFVLRILQFEKQDWVVLRGVPQIALSTVGATCLVALINHLEPPLPALARLLLGGVAFSCAYLCLLVLTGALNKEEKHFGSRYLRRIIRVGVS